MGGLGGLCAGWFSVAEGALVRVNKIAQGYCFLSWGKWRSCKESRVGACAMRWV